jgi:hypothetical protein
VKGTTRLKLCVEDKSIMDNLELKALSSQKKLGKALIELLQYKDFLDINVKELCLLAKVNRTTFYAHYDNTFELLEETKQNMINDFLASYKNKSFKDVMNSDFNIDLISEEYVLPYLKFIKKNKNIYNVYVKCSLALGTEEYFTAIVNNIAKPLFEKNAKSDGVEILYISRFYVEGINSIVKLWIKRELKESEEYICKIILKLRSKESA